jgi:phosphatidylglycerophosphate synthase
MPTPATDLRHSPAAAQRLPRGTMTAVLLAAAATVSGGLLAGLALGDEALPWRAVVLALGGGSALLWLAARRLPAPTFGAANAVTLVRGVLVLLLVASLGAVPTGPLAWLLVTAATVAVTLDGVDGALARGRGEASAFGARFDMEIDALLILVLAVLVWQHDKAGVWIVLAGLLRYLFVAASYAAPWLGEQLPPSRRRQAVCVVQIASLIGALTPFVVQPWSAWIALGGLALLLWSFGIDVVWLAQRARS